MPDVLITGGSGFIAAAALRRLRELPGVRAQAASVRGGRWKDLDLSRYDCIVHTAGVAHVSPDPSLADAYRTVNFELTRDLAQKAKADGCSHFIFLSSMIVFGQAARAGERRLISPDTPPAPVNAYGQSKLDAENALHALEGDGFRAAILRPPMVYGRGCKGNYNALRSLARKLPIFPEYENRRSMLYVENLAELIAQIALSGASGTFHPSDGQPRSVSEIVRQICLCHGKTMRFSRILAPLVTLAGGRGVVRRAFGDMAYDASMPDFPGDYRRFSFEEGVRRTEGDEKW